MADHIYLGAGEGLFVLETDGGTARLLADSLAGKRITAINLISGAIFVSAARDGVYRSDGGQGAFHCTLPGDTLSLAGSPVNPYLLLCGTEPAAAFHSADFGENWRELDGLRRVTEAAQWYHPAPLRRPRVTRMVFHPDDPCSYWAAIEVGGVFFSSDCGFHFVSRSRGLPPDIHDLLIDPEAPQRLWAATGAGVYASADGGVEWRPAGVESLRGYVTHLAALPGAVPILLASTVKGPPPDAQRGAAGTLWRSDDLGQTWHEAMAGLPGPLEGAFAGFATAEGTGRIYTAASSGECLVSEDEGRSWRVIAEGLPPVYAIAVEGG
ncbi:MAG: hypothetical protein NTZ05_14430 [Chloroflexi bacterium]|nr:hypothetical protein [Chloroflexota bacterium]